MEDLIIEKQGFEVFRQELPPVLPKPSISFQNNQIHLSWRAMRMLGNPDYATILVNPDEKKMIIKACEQAEANSIVFHKKADGRATIGSCGMLINQLKQRFEWPSSGRYVFHATQSDLFPFALTINLDDSIYFPPTQDDNPPAA